MEAALEDPRRKSYVTQVPERDTLAARGGWPMARQAVEVTEQGGVGRLAHDPAPLPQVVESIIGASTGDALFVVDPDYRIVHWDARAESLTGLLAEEMIGIFAYEAVQGECEGGTSFSAHECSSMRLALAGEPICSYEMSVFTRSGGRRWVSVSTLGVETEKGSYLVHLMRDSQAAHTTLEMAYALIESSGRRADEPRQRPRSDAPELTPRQLEVLKLLSRGKPAPQIGRELFLSQATVRNHIRSLLQALGAHSQLEALAKARAVGLLSG